MSVILTHLLNQRYQPDRATRSWDESILEQRSHLERVLRDSPSLRAKLRDLLPDAYHPARMNASRQTHLDLSTFPEACPWPAAELLGE